MQRVETLIKKLQEQFNSGATAAQLQLTVQMLQAELASLQDGAVGHNNAVMIDIPQVLLPVNDTAKEMPETPQAEEEKVFEVLQVNEEDIEAELEEIKRNAEAMQKMSLHHKPQIVFDDEPEEIPTLAHQPKKETEKPPEINEAIAQQHHSINEKLKQSKLELSDALTEAPIRDLRKAIGVNDRFLFIKELFRGDETMYERSIKTINSFSILPEAEYWMQRELKVKLGWSDSNEAVQQFVQLVKRRFT